MMKEGIYDKTRFLLEIMHLAFRFTCNVLRITKLHHLYVKLVEVSSTIHVEKYNRPPPTHKNPNSYSFIKYVVFRLDLSC
jgi:hypothetical protein